MVLVPAQKLSGLEPVYMEVGDPRRVRSDEAGHSTYDVNVIKLKRETIWTEGLPHLSRLP